MKALPFLIFFSFLSNLSSHGIETYGPSFAGTQLSFYPTNVDPGHVSVQPYLFMHHHYGFYKKNWDSTSQNSFNRETLQFSLEAGILKSLDFQVNTHVDYSQYKGHHSILYGDIRSYFGWQITREEEDTWIPNSRLLLGESFPTGKYDKLDPKKGFSDISSSGAFETVFILVVAKTFMSFPTHPFNFNLNLFYILPSNVNVKGVNAYGGEAHTKGTVAPGAQTIVNFAVEYSLTPRWTIGSDFRYVHQNSSSFSGRNGDCEKGTRRVCGLPSSEQFSIAPVLEYSWSRFFGAAFGGWVTVAGRNSENFLGVGGNVYYYF